MIFTDLITGYIFAFATFSTQVTCTMVSTKKPTSCPAYTVESPDGFCYKAFTNRKYQVTWLKARNYCRREVGGDLVSIRNKEENDFIATNLNKFFRWDFWIGLNDRDEEGDYRWSDGTTSQYRYWSSYEPNDGHHNEDCVQYSHRYHRWSDRNCFFSQGFVCKWKKGAATPGITGFEKPVTSLHCPNDKWRFYNGSCYYASTDFDTNAYLSWYDARDYCYNMSSRLTSIHSIDENNVLISMISANFISAFWTGLSEVGMEHYQWSDDSPLDFVYWDENQPSDSYGGEDCVGIVVQSGLWNDLNCAEKKGYICKKSIGESYTKATTPPHTGGCPNGFHSHGSKCFSIQGMNQVNQVNWSMAVNRCKSMGKHFSLVSIHSEVENEFLVTLLRGTETTFWIGLNDLSLFRYFEWQDNSPVGYTNWDKDQPTNAFVNFKGDREQCVEISGNSSNAGKWNDDACYLQKGYICQTFKDPSIPIVPRTPDPIHPGYMYYGTSHYKLDKTPRSWADSLHFCSAEGGNIVSITGVFEQAFVFQLIQNSASPVWIGLSDSKMIGLYGWSDGWPVQFTYWGDDEPSVESLEGCVIMMKDGTWNDTICQLKFPVICEINTVPPPKTTPVPPGYCPSRKMKMHGDYCYSFSTEKQNSWSDALKDCQQMGMDLASIHSADDSNFIFSLVKTSLLAKHPWIILYYIWIGLTKSQTGGFQWIDGTPMDYVNWDVNEPNNSTDRQYCINIYSFTKKWRSFDCTGKQHYICQTRKIISNTRTAARTTKTTTTSINTMSLSTKKINNHQNVVDPRGPGGSSPDKDPVTSVGLAFIFIGCILALIVICIVVIVMKKKQILIFRNSESGSVISFDTILSGKSRIKHQHMKNEPL